MLDLEGSLFVPQWLLSSIVVCLGLVLSSLDLQDDEGVLILESVKISVKICRDNEYDDLSTCCLDFTLG